jgi:hypothetical protein
LPITHRSQEHDEVSIEADDQFEKEQEAIDAISVLKSMQENTVQLDVGGYKVETTRETLSRIPSKFSKFQREIKTKGNTPTYFIDRDPKHFGFILNYLRNNGEMDKRMFPQEKSALSWTIV